MSRRLYTKDESISLCWISEEDKVHYISMINQEEKRRFDSSWDKIADCLWNTVTNGTDLVFCVFDNKDEFLGTVSLYNPDNDEPEIGIDLLEKYRNKGIAKKAIRLLINEDYLHNKRSCYMVRIMSENKHSQHVFEKIGAVLQSIEESPYKKLLVTLKEAIIKEENKEKLQEIIEQYENKDEGVYIYKLFPEVYVS